MKILVTGGTGVIGAAAIPALLRAGHHVRLLSRHAERDVEGWPKNVEAFTADISNPNPLREALAGCEAVVHIAGIVDEQPPEITFAKINVDGTRALCAAAEVVGQPYLIYISSLGAERGESNYHRSKFTAEQHVRGYAGPWLILRPANVYGPGDETMAMLLKMIRTLPSVPMVGEGDQPFQPLWYADFGEVIARAVDRQELAGRTLELAGPDTTTTEDVLNRLVQITGRNPPRLEIPAWVARVGASALESFGGLGKRLLDRAGLEAPITPAKLQMLLEGNVLTDPKENALVSVFGVAPTRLQSGLEILADLLPEEMPGDGVGAVHRTIYSAEILGTKFTPEELIDLVCERFSEIMPMEFAAEPGVPASAEEKGTTLTGAIPARGNIQVRLEERTPTVATFVTIDGHPLAGVLRFTAGRLLEGVRFSIEIAAQPANVVDWIAMRTVGGMMQSRNWREVVRHVIDASGGEAPAGVKKQSERLTADEVTQLATSVRHLIDQRKRRETEQAVESRA